VGGSTAKETHRGTLTLGARLQATTINVVHEAVCPDIGPICAVRDEPPQVHDQQFYLGELRLSADYAFFEWLSAELQVPLRLSGTTITFRRLDGTPFEPEGGDIHHRNETLFGVGDPWLSVKPSFRWKGFTAQGRVGLTLPLGRTEPNPFVLGRMGLQHQHVQFGTGTVNPLLGLQLAQRLGERVTPRLYGLAQLSLGQNQYGYQAGSRVLSGLAVDVQVHESLTLTATGDVLVELPERWDGVIEQDGNVGRVDVLVGAAVEWRVGGFTLSLAGRGPVYQYFFHESEDHGQLRFPFILSLGVERAFDLLR
ncbi:MAG TPA: hypothetical protein VGD87_15490, partial [Archangium sp.]